MQKGFTLIEAIISLVVIGILMAVLGNLFFPDQVRQSSDQVQIRCKDGVLVDSRSQPVLVDGVMMRC